MATRRTKSGDTPPGTIGTGNRPRRRRESGGPAPAVRPRPREPGRERPFVTNSDIADALHEMSARLAGEEVPFKPQAYERAALAVESMTRPVSDIYDEQGAGGLEDIPSVGHGIAERIGELLETGKVEDLEALRQKLPVDMMGLTEVEGVGPQTVRALHEALAVRTLDDLDRVVREHQVRTVPHFGEKSEQKLAKALEFHHAAHSRRPLGDVLGIVRGIEERLARAEGVERLEVAGSVRRRKETIGDVDVVVASTRPAEVVAAFVAMPEVRHVYAQGDTKTLVRLQGGIDADLRIVEPGCFGAALQYFTGNKDHNVAIRGIARKKGMKLSEYGLFRGDELVAAQTEEEIYAALGMELVPPEIRENTGEVEAAIEHRLPALVAYEKLDGDLQVHTTWTDGTGSVREMVEAMQRLGRRYLAITDHARDLPMARGLDEVRLREQIAEIRRVDEAVRGIRVLAGVEANIRPDGTLDLAADALAGLDFVGAAVHSHFEQSKHDMTLRLVRAIENPLVDVLFHPLGRVFGKRPAVDADLDAVIAAARRTGTVLEIDAQPHRLDLRDDVVRKAVQAGVHLVVDSDAHHVSQLGYPETFGIAVARRGWAQSEHVLNRLPLKAFLSTLKPRPRPILSLVP